LAQSTVVSRHSPLPALLAAALMLLFLAPQASLLAQQKAPDHAVAETGMPVLLNYSAKDFNATPQIWTILQDRRGLIYFGDSAWPTKTT
jgi:hypothetical protein